MKSITPRKPPKNQREKLLLLGLVDLYLKDGKPVSSNALKENGFDSLSSATIRNYFEKLEEEGFLKQQHSSGGRIPTPLAYEAYIKEYVHSPFPLAEKERKGLQEKLSKETREIASYLQQAAEAISEATKCALFLSAPRFDQDFVLDIKIVGIDQNRCLCILITDFSLVQTELLYTDKKLSNFSLKRIEAFFRWKLTSLDKPALSEEEEALATKFYSEVMLRHLIGNAHFSTEDLYKTGFAKMLAYEDFQDASALATGLAIFENKESLKTLLSECCKKAELTYWVGGDLQACSCLAIPYKINQTIVGALAILGPNRIPYRKLFAILETASALISESLTKSIYKFKIAFRHPAPTLVEFKKEGALSHLLLENKHDRK